jgi:hypothetical protein
LGPWYSPHATSITAAEWSLECGDGGDPHAATETPAAAMIRFSVHATALS